MTRPIEEQRCPQCWQFKPLIEFTQGPGKYKNCNSCRAHMRSRGRVTDYRKGLRTTAAEPRVKWIAKSGNRKIGPIPTSMTSSETCPPSCGFFNTGCYGEHSYLRMHWRAAAEGLFWEAFCDAVRALPEWQLWRHNTVGDLPGIGEELCASDFKELVAANRGRRGFTFTHKKDPRVLRLYMWAAQEGFVINLSADDLAEADRLAETGLPVAVTLDEHEARTQFKTPGGRQLTRCPATYEWLPGMNCQRCQLCARPGRKTIIGFPAHGTAKGLVNLRVREKDGAQLQLFK